MYRNGALLIECWALLIECRALWTEYRTLLTECRALLKGNRALLTECRDLLTGNNALWTESRALLTGYRALLTEYRTLLSKYFQGSRISPKWTQIQIDCLRWDCIDQNYGSFGRNKALLTEQPCILSKTCLTKKKGIQGSFEQKRSSCDKVLGSFDIILGFLDRVSGPFGCRTFSFFFMRRYLFWVVPRNNG